MSARVEPKFMSLQGRSTLLGTHKRKGHKKVDFVFYSDTSSHLSIQMTISSLTSRRVNASSTLTFNNCSTCPSPLDIPEILERIFSSLDHKSIFHSAQYVCRQWYLISRRFPTRPLVFDGDKPLSKSFKQVIEDQLSYAGSFYWVSKSLKDDRPNWDHFQGMLKSMHDNTNAHRATKPEELRVQAPLHEFYFHGMFYLPCFLSALLYMDTLTSLHIDCLITVELPLDIILSTCSELVTLYLDGQSYLIRLAKQLDAPVVYEHGHPRTFGTFIR